MPVPADDDVVVHRDPQRFCHIDHRAGHLDVGLRRRWIAGGVIVHHDDRGGGELQRALDDFARIDRRVIDGADLLHLIRNQLVALVEKQDAKLLLVGEGHRGAAIVDYGGPGRQYGAALQLALADAGGRGGDQPDLGDRGLAEAADLTQPRFGRVHRFGERAELADQRLGQRLDVAPRQRAEQHHLQQFIVAQRVGAGAAKALAQPLAMAVIMRGLFKAGQGIDGLLGICGHGHNRAGGTARQHAVPGSFCNSELPAAIRPRSAAVRYAASTA